MRNPNLVVTLPEDVQAPKGVRPSATKVQAEKIGIFTIKFICLAMIPWHFSDSMTLSQMTTKIQHDIPATKVSNHHF